MSMAQNSAVLWVGHTIQLYYEYNEYKFYVQLIVQLFLQNLKSVHCLKLLLYAATGESRIEVCFQFVPTE